MMLLNFCILTQFILLWKIFPLDISPASLTVMFAETDKANLVIFFFFFFCFRKCFTQQYRPTRASSFSSCSFSFILFTIEQCIFWSFCDKLLATLIFWQLDSTAHPVNFHYPYSFDSVFSNVSETISNSSFRSSLTSFSVSLLP